LSARVARELSVRGDPSVARLAAALDHAQERRPIAT
jgi:hypothetical protein